MSKKNPIRVVFFGTPEFALPSLRALHDNSAFEIAAVVTQPDKPSGRKQEPVSSPIKMYATENNLRLHQPETLKDDDIVTQLKELEADVFVVVAYGKLIPEVVYSIPKHDTLNIHPSLLPKYRGPSPMQAAIRNGDTKTGVSLILVRKKMDAGDILEQREMNLTPDTTIEDLHDKAAVIGAEILQETIPSWINGEITPTKQGEKEATFCKLIKREDGEVDWNQSAKDILQQFRALHPWPGVYTSWNGSRVKFLEVRSTNNPDPLDPGKAVEKNGSLFIGTSSAPIEVIKLQKEGKKDVFASEFLRGAPQFLDSVLPS